MNLDNFLVRPARRVGGDLRRLGGLAAPATGEGRRHRPATWPDCPRPNATTTRTPSASTCILLRLQLARLDGDAVAVRAAAQAGPGHRRRPARPDRDPLGQGPGTAARPALRRRVVGRRHPADARARPPPGPGAGAVRGEDQAGHRLLRLRRRARRGHRRRAPRGHARAPTGSGSAPRPAPTSATTRTTSPCSGSAATCSSPRGPRTRWRRCWSSPAPAPKTDIARAREESHGLGLFVRSLVGLDREAATAAFDRYLSDTTFSANQLRFVQLIVEHLTANGVMEVARLYESPFTDNAPQGPDMIFSEEQIDGHRGDPG